MAASLAVTPAVAFCRLVSSGLLGGLLGLFYDCLRPLGRRHRHFADLVFSLGAVWVWIYHSFAVCRGDIRLVCLAAMAVGMIFWECTAGKWWQPLFDLFWSGLARLWGFILFPWKKFLDFAKILFASVEKWVTIECTKIFGSGQKRRKESHGREKDPAQKSEDRNSSHIQYP